MQIGKLVAVAVAIAINGIAIAAFLAWNAHTRTVATPPVQAQAVTTLPVTNVYPSADEWRVLDSGARTRG